MRTVHVNTHIFCIHNDAIPLQRNHVTLNRFLISSQLILHSFSQSLLFMRKYYFEKNVHNYLNKSKALPQAASDDIAHTNKEK